MSNIQKIKNHPYFSGIEWNNIKNSDNRYIKGYVKKRIRNFKPIKIEEAMNAHSNKPNVEHTFFSERVDNLHIINIELHFEHPGFSFF